MRKFGRNYILTIEGNDGRDIEIKPPFTLDFTVIRNVLSSSNISTLRIFNLNQRTRALIRKDQFDYGRRKRVSLLAGYGNNLSVVMSGNVTQAFSVRMGTNYITEIQAFDGGYAYANAQISKQYKAQTPYRNMVDDLMNALTPYGVEKGAIGQIDGASSRGYSFSGSIIKSINEIANGNFFIDRNKSYVLGESEALSGEIEVISSESGLLGTPRREQSFLSLSMLFEPSLAIGQRIKLDSSTGENYNGFYKIVSLAHRGIISESVAGEATTDVGLFYGAKYLTEVAEV